MYEYEVVRDYHDSIYDFDMNEGDIVTDADFDEPDIPARLVGMGVLKPADMEAEEARLADGEPDEDEPDEEDE